MKTRKPKKRGSGRSYDYAVLYRCGKNRSYFVRMTGIGPAMGGSVKTAWRAESESAALSVLNSFPIVAAVCCRIVRLVARASVRS